MIQSPAEIPLGPTRASGKASREVTEMFVRWALLLFLLDVAFRRFSLPWQAWLKRLVPTTVPPAPETDPGLMTQLMEAKKGAFSTIPVVEALPEKESRERSREVKPIEKSPEESGRSTLDHLKSAKEKLRRWKPKPPGTAP